MPRTCSGSESKRPQGVRSPCLSNALDIPEPKGVAEPRNTNCCFRSAVKLLAGSAQVSWHLTSFRSNCRLHFEKPVRRRAIDCKFSLANENAVQGSWHCISGAKAEMRCCYLKIFLQPKNPLNLAALLDIPRCCREAPTHSDQDKNREPTAKKVENKSRLPSQARKVEERAD